MTKQINIDQLEYLTLDENIENDRSNLKSGKQKNKGTIWSYAEEISPLSLYCYLNARFGKPNGVQMILKNDSSDNLIHWHYTLKYGSNRLEIMCFNFRVDIMHSINFDDEPLAKDNFIRSIKNDFQNYGKKISQFRGKLEKWSLFINPFHRIRNVIEEQLKKLEGLQIQSLPRPKHPHDSKGMKEYLSLFEKTEKKYTEATALGLNIRMLAPVYAESFINLLIFLLAKSEVKSDDRLYSSIIRQNIDIRIKSLHLYCNGFYQPVDYKEEACKNFHTLMNSRNDLFHGNIDPKLNQFDTVFFDKSTPLPKEFKDLAYFTWESSLRNVSPELAINDYEIVQNFIAYLLICLDDKSNEVVKRFMKTKTPGYNKKDQRVGVLFPEHVVDLVPIHNVKSPK